MPPRQLAVLILRDVLGFHADEVAEMLDTTVESVNSALKRARAGLDGQQQSAASPPGARAVPEQAMVAKFVSAYETADIDSLVALLTDDVFNPCRRYPSNTWVVSRCGGSSRRCSVLAGGTISC